MNDPKFYNGTNGDPRIQYSDNRDGGTNYDVAIGNRVQIGPDGRPYMIGSQGQRVEVGGIGFSNDGTSADPVDSLGNVIDGKWQAEREGQLADRHNWINGHTAGITTNAEGYSAGAYDPYSISKANGFGTQFGEGKSGAAQMGDYAGANASLATAAGLAQQGNDDSYQRAALQQNYAVMNGAPSLGYTQGLQSMRAGADAQQAAAASAMGGSLGQAAAMRQNAQGAAGYNAQGMQQAAAVQAQAQDQARQQYAAQLSAMRTSTQQGINAGQAIAGTSSQNAQDQASFAQQQNAMHDQASLYGQNMSDQMKASNYSQQQKELDMASQDRRLQQQQKNQEDKNTMQTIGAGVKAGASVIAMSDVRTKEPVSLASAAEMRYWR